MPTATPDQHPLLRCPTLTTQRLTLRLPTHADLDDCTQARSDPETTRFVGGPATREACWRRLLSYIGMWSALGFGNWTIRETATGSYVGEIGFADYERRLMPDLLGVPEAGWVLARHAHGQGFATEALSAILAWGDVHLPNRRTIAMIAPENAPSLRVAEKAGYKPFARTIYASQPVVLLDRMAARIEL